eukprot:CAMPEP_0174261552 /NCGR_PEP_ID=MMETSP0439-20130205/11494_1 /TAXON_ID=0 /ORGANISM="Stereomyxa ramosa, Strain Chinc5" /LENGTH=1028 /DNA_ID=CAMNT_0015346041 /DNA_START=22 /DNA_END=3108 /DNA_ORIENTATION=-
MEEKLTDLQKAEIKKAFSICDKDGDGHIDAHELGIVMGALLGEQPSEKAVKEVLKTIDTDHSGTVEWEEFLSAMTNWFQEDYKPSGKVKMKKSSMKRKRSPEKERRQVHKRIRNFFAQFQGSDFSKIRRRLEEEDLDSLNPGFYKRPMEVDVIQEATPENKLRYLVECKKNIQKFEYFCNGLNSESHHLQLEALSEISRLLLIVQIFETPEERRGVAEVIIKIFETILRSSITPRLVHLLQHSENYKIQVLVARILALFSPGPRIASTPEDSLLHPKQQFFKKIVVSEGAVPLLITHTISSPSIEVREACVLALGNLAAHDPSCRDLLLENNIVSALLQNIKTDTPVEMLQEISWVMSLLCGVTHPRDKLPAWDLIKPMFPALGVLLFNSTSAEVLVNLCAAFALVLPGIPQSEPQVLVKFIELLSSSDCPRIIRGVLQTISNVVRYDDKQTEILVKSKLCETLKELLKSEDDLVRLDVCELLILLAGIRKKIQAIIAAKIVPKLLKLLSTDELVRWKVAKVIKYLTRGKPPHIDYLVKEGTVTVLSRVLTYFKVYDSVLTQIYKYCGPSYNFEFVIDVLSALHNIVNTGEMDAEEKKKLNQYALSFDLGCVDNLKTVLQAIEQAPPEELQAWRQKKEDSQPTVQDRIKSLLFKIKRVHDNNSDSPISIHISKMIQDIWNNFFGDVGHQERILLKCYHENEVRITEIPADISFASLQRALRAKYGDMHITYEDEEGDEVTLDNQKALQTAISQYRKQATRTLKIKIITEAPLRSPAATPAPSLRGSPVTSPRNSPPSSPQQRRGKGYIHAPRNSGKASPAPRVVFPIATPPLEMGNISLEEDLDSIKRGGRRDMFQDLASRTHFSAEELQRLYSSWRKQAQPDGNIGRKEFEAGLKSMGITDPLVLEQNFSAFDVNKDGKINFREFVTGLSVVQKGTMEERLKFLFNAYDVDGSGTLTIDEVYNIFKSSLASSGQKVDEKELQQIVQDCFAQIDTNNDGELDYEEFKKAVQNQTLMINCFVHYPDQKK